MKLLKIEAESVGPVMSPNYFEEKDGSYYS